VKYLQSGASRFVHGERDTTNPTMAARFVMGRGGGRALRRYKRRAIRPKRFKGNPTLASVASLVPGGGLVGGLLGGLSGRFKPPSEARAAGLAPQLVTAALQGNLTAARAIIDKTQIGVQKERAVWQAALTQLTPAIVAAVQKYAKSIPMPDYKNVETTVQTALARPFQLPGTAAGGASPFTALATPQGVALAGKIITTATRRSRRQRYPTYTDRYGRQRYSYKEPGGQLRIPAGATPTPGTPYSFFRGAVGAGGAAATAGQLAVAGAAGVAAYLVTQRLLAALGGRAQGKEEAGVSATLALRQARADFEKQHGRKLTAAESREMSAAWKTQLLELGYNPTTFTRERSGFESFLETYNPLGG